MAKTVGEAFDSFIKNSVNLDPDVVSRARASRDELLGEIHKFNADGDFFKLWNEIDLHFGSFSRKTKCRPLDDLDLMIGLSAEGATYDSQEDWNDVDIDPSPNSLFQQKCKNEDGMLSSSMVLGKFKEKIKDVEDLRRIEVKKNKQAIVVDYKTSEWSFDIVPCFHTTKESDGRDYFLIPNGSGKWMKTDPVLDQERVKQLNVKHKNKMLIAIRLVKYWNLHAKVITLKGYFLECLLLQYFDKYDASDDNVGRLFRDLMAYLYSAVLSPVPDPKNIQGNLNDLSILDRNSISEKAQDVYRKAKEALDAEALHNVRRAINKWKEIFGDEFPEYTGV